jgi:hypothetical protein
LQENLHDPSSLPGGTGSLMPRAAREAAEAGSEA